MAFNKAKVIEDIQKYIQKGQIDKAIEEYERVIRIDPRDYKLRQKLGDLYLRKGKNAEAVNQYMQVAEYYVQDGFYLKAIALYSQILRTDPSKLFIYEKLSELYKKQGLIGDAVSKLRSLAEIYEKQRNLSEAIQTWEKIINIDPENIIYRGKLVEFYLKQGLATRAAEKLQQAVDFFKGKGRYDDVEKLLEHFPGIVEEDKTIGIKMARSLLSEGKFKDALEKIDQYLKVNPKDADGFFIKGTCYLNINQYNLSKHAFEVSLKLAPESTDARKGLLKVFVKEKNWTQLILTIQDLFKIYSKSKAYEEFKSIIDNYYPYIPEEKRLLSLYIDLFRITGDTKSLLEKLKKLASVYNKEGNKEEVIKLYKEVLTIDSSDEDANKFFEQLKLQEKEQELTPSNLTTKAVLQEKPIEVIQPVIEEMDVVQEATIDADLEELTGLLNFGLISRAKIKLEELSLRYPDSFQVKEKWLRYFEITKDTDAYYMVLNEIIDKCQKEENIECLEYYKKLLYEKDKFKKTSAHVSSTVSTEVVATPKPVIEHVAEEEILIPEEFEEEAEILSPNIDDLLIEADFYYKRDMVDEAIKVYEKILEIEPENKIAKERVEVHKNQKESTTNEVKEEPQQQKEEEEFYDLSGEIMQELEKEDFFETSFKSEAEKISFEQLLKEFKGKISQEIEEGDVETHYNLGIAYKEMGLYDDAIQEFVLTSRFSQKAYDSFIMVATCLSEKKEYEKALEFYKKALKMPDLEEQKLAGIYLEVGTLYEKIGDIKKALFCFNKAFSIDTTLRIAKEKVNNILLENPELSGTEKFENFEL